MKSYRKWIPLIAFPLLIGTGFILWSFTQGVVHFFQGHWLILLISLIIIFGPWGRRRLAATDNEAPRHGLGGWLTRIFMLQLCCYAVFLGISTVCGQTAAPLTPPHPGIFQLSLTHLLVREGLFPWALFALMAVCFGYYSYCQKQDAYLATIVSPVIHNHTIHVIINFFARLNTSLAYASSFALVSLLWASTVPASPIITGYSLATMLLTLLLLGISYTKFYRRGLRKAISGDLPLIAGVYFWVALLAVAIWLINGFLVPILDIKLAPPLFLYKWQCQPWQDLWLIFANSWWLCWLPMLAVTLARISRGYRVREVIIAILILPLLASIGLGFTQQMSWDIPPLWAVLITAVGLLGLLLFTLRPLVLASFVQSFLPQQDEYRFRSPRSVITKILQGATAFLFIYLPSGMPLLHFLLFACVIPLILIALLSIVLFIFRCSK